MIKNNTIDDPPQSLRKMETDQTNVIQEFLKTKREEGDLPTLEQSNRRDFYVDKKLQKFLIKRHNHNNSTIPKSQTYSNYIKQQNDPENPKDYYLPDTSRDISSFSELTFYGDPQYVIDQDNKKIENIHTEPKQKESSSSDKTKKQNHSHSHSHSHNVDHSKSNDHNLVNIVSNFYKEELEKQAQKTQTDEEQKKDNFHSRKPTLFNNDNQQNSTLQTKKTILPQVTINSQKSNKEQPISNKLKLKIPKLTLNNSRTPTVFEQKQQNDKGKMFQKKNLTHFHGNNIKPKYNYGASTSLNVNKNGEADFTELLNQQIMNMMKEKDEIQSFRSHDTGAIISERSNTNNKSRLNNRLSTFFKSKMDNDKTSRQTSRAQNDDDSNGRSNLKLPLHADTLDDEWSPDSSDIDQLNDNQAKQLEKLKSSVNKELKNILKIKKTNQKEDTMVNDIATKIILDQTQAALPEIKTPSQAHNRSSSAMLSAKGKHQQEYEQWVQQETLRQQDEYYFTQKFLATPKPNEYAFLTTSFTRNRNLPSSQEYYQTQVIPPQSVSKRPSRGTISKQITHQSINHIRSKSHQEIVDLVVKLAQSGSPIIDEIISQMHNTYQSQQQ